MIYLITEFLTLLLSLPKILCSWQVSPSLLPSFNPAV